MPKRARGNTYGTTTTPTPVERPRFAGQKEKIGRLTHETWSIPVRGGLCERGLSNEPQLPTTKIIMYKLGNLT